MKTQGVRYVLNLVRYEVEGHGGTAAGAEEGTSAKKDRCQGPRRESTNHIAAYMCLQGAKAEEVRHRGTWRQGGGGSAWR